MKAIVVLLLSVAAVFAEENAIVVNPGYKAGEYSFSGTVETEMGAFKTVYTFTGKTTHDSFECSWVNDMGMMKTGGEVKVDKQGRHNEDGRHGGAKIFRSKDGDRLCNGGFRWQCSPDVFPLDR